MKVQTLLIIGILSIFGICVLSAASPATGVQGRESVPVRRALVFGLGRQADKSWGKIHGDQDVRYVVLMLDKLGYTDISVLKNEQATKAAMVEAFKSLASRCRKGDNVYVHYSGHGQLMTDLDGDEAAKWRGGRHAEWDESWVPYDAYMTYGPHDHGEKHLSDDEVASLLAMIRQKIGKQGELMVVVDACHSGDATCGEQDECVRGVDMKFCIPKSVGMQAPAKPVAEQWLTVSACKPYQLCTEIKDPQVGKLTYALYKLGPAFFNNDPMQMEQLIVKFMERYKGTLPQTPMVTGRKKMED